MKSFILFIILLVVAFFSLSIFKIIQIKDNIEEDEIFISKNLLDIQFKGKVIDRHVIDRYGKKYYIACVKIEYSNKKDFYLFKDNHGLKIKNGIATISGGVLLNAKVLTYVEVNIQKNKKQKFIYADGSIDEHEVTLGAGAMKESDFDACN